MSRGEVVDQPGLATRAAACLIAAIAVMLAAAGSASAKPNLPPIDLSSANRCDFIASPENRLCLLPFPND